MNKRAREDFVCSEVFNYLFIFRRDGRENKQEKRKPGGLEGGRALTVSNREGRGRVWVRPIHREQGCGLQGEGGGSGKCSANGLRSTDSNTGQ